MTTDEPDRVVDEPISVFGLVVVLFVVLCVVDGIVQVLLVFLDVPRMAGVRDATLSISFSIWVVAALLLGSSQANRAVSRTGTRGIAIGAFVLCLFASLFVISWGATFTTNEALEKTVLFGETPASAPLTRRGLELVSWHFLDAVPVLSLPAVFAWKEPGRPDDPPFVFGVSLALARLTAVISLAGFAKGLWDLLHRETEEIGDEGTGPPSDEPSVRA